MAGIYGISNYSLTGNYGYGYSTGAVSSALSEEKGVVINPGKSDVEKPGRKSSPAECGTVYTAGGTTTTKISYSDESNPYQQN